MEPTHKLTLYISYYLSRFNNEALDNLGYTTWNNAFEDIGKRLNVKPHSVKNWRDEFDPLFGHRAGWYQRPMSPSRVKVVQALEDLNESQIRGIATDILTGKIKSDPEEVEQLLSIVTDDTKDKIPRKFILRAPTGKAAENYFIQYYKETFNPIKGTLIDCRDLGCGYDFKIESNGSKTYIEVKGLADFSGGVLFTDKEWQVATEKGEDFFLCIIKNVNENPEINFIQNPAFKIKPKKNIYTTIQINWSVTEKDLNTLNA
ncbi:MAG: DUF3883 domain-containing protein [Bacteroidota bacterium]|nr:DUF3883 domain-containing protein [Bacteroidota bacterium]